MLWGHTSVLEFMVPVPVLTEPWGRIAGSGWGMHTATPPRLPGQGKAERVSLT